MIREQSAGTGPAIGIDSRATVDFYIALLSDKDMNVRRHAVAVLGASGDRRAIEPLMFSLSRELALGAESFVVVIDVVEALERLPDSRVLDLLLKIEAQLIDYGSPGCRADLAAGAVIYRSKGDRRIERVVPREVHYKVFEGLRRISSTLGDRAEIVAERFRAYQTKVMGEEVNRLMPRLSDIMTDSLSELPEPPGYAAASDGLPADVTGDDAIARLPDDLEAVAGNNLDHELIKREMEVQILDYINKNEDMLTMIQQGKSLKARIRQAREENGKLASAIPSRSVRAFVR